MGSASALFSAVPAGATMGFAGSTAPAGWLLCYGQAVSRTSYAALFAAISTTYGAGDSSTTFNLPDLRGRAVFGRDDMGGAAADRLRNTAIDGTVQNPVGTTLGATGGSDRRQISRNGALSTGVNATSTSPGLAVSQLSALDGVDATWGVSGAAGGAKQSSAVPPAIVLNYIIKT